MFRVKTKRGLNTLKITFCFIFQYLLCVKNRKIRYCLQIRRLLNHLYVTYCCLLSRDEHKTPPTSPLLQKFNIITKAPLNSGKE